MIRREREGREWGEGKKVRERREKGRVMERESISRILLSEPIGSYATCIHHLRRRWTTTGWRSVVWRRSERRREADMVGCQTLPPWSSPAQQQNTLRLSLGLLNLCRWHTVKILVQESCRIRLARETCTSVAVSCTSFFSYIQVSRLCVNSISTYVFICTNRSKSVDESLQQNRPRTVNYKRKLVPCAELPVDSSCEPSSSKFKVTWHKNYGRHQKSGPNKFRYCPPVKESAVICQLPLKMADEIDVENGRISKFQRHVQGRREPARAPGQTPSPGPHVRHQWPIIPCLLHIMPPRDADSKVN